MMDRASHQLGELGVTPTLRPKNVVGLPLELHVLLRLSALWLASHVNRRRRPVRTQPRQVRRSN